MNGQREFDRYKVTLHKLDLCPQSEVNMKVWIDMLLSEMTNLFPFDYSPWYTK